MGRTSEWVLEAALLDAEGFEPLPGDWIVNQLAEDGERPVGCEAFREPEGITNAEADAIMFSDMDGHGWWIVAL
jgi:hypothetical protein